MNAARWLLNQHSNKECWLTADYTPEILFLYMYPGLTCIIIDAEMSYTLKGQFTHQYMG